MPRNDRDNFRNQREVREACYKARLVLRRTTATIEEVRAAGLVLNKAVRTLQSWIGSINYDKRTSAQWQSEKRERDKHYDHGKGPLIPLTYAPPDGQDYRDQE